MSPTEKIDGVGLPFVAVNSPVAVNVTIAAFAEFTVRPTAAIPISMMSVNDLTMLMARPSSYRIRWLKTYTAGTV